MLTTTTTTSAQSNQQTNVSEAHVPRICQWPVARVETKQKTIISSLSEWSFCTISLCLFRYCFGSGNGHSRRFGCSIIVKVRMEWFFVLHFYRLTIFLRKKFVSWLQWNSTIELRMAELHSLVVVNCFSICYIERECLRCLLWHRRANALRMFKTMLSTIGTKLVLFSTE